MMASNSDFKLVSAATAIAIIASPEHHPEINKLRSVHDKAYHKWQPHINILYPFVQALQLDDAIVSLKSALLKANIARINIKIDEVGVFRHRKNATLFLKPDSESATQIGELRKCLVQALGRDESDGTHDGVFRPHLTIGQAGLQGDSVERLSDKIQKLVGIEWECSSLAVLKRKPTGEMELVDTLALGDRGSENSDLPLRTLTVQPGRNPCFSLAKNGDWDVWSKAGTAILSDSETRTEITVATYNLLTEPLAPPFTIRFPLILESITSAFRSGPGLRVLCLQEVNDEILPLLLNNPQIQKLCPYSTHAPSSVLESKRNLVTLASEPFTSSTVDFAERHKSSLVIKFFNANITVANVHLTSALTDVSVAVKIRQMKTLTDFLKKDSGNSGPIFVAGDFNLTSSPKTIKTALARRIITPSTATSIKNVIDENTWEDAFIKYLETDSGEEYDDSDCEHDYAGEDGITFDRLNNPLAALSKGPVDDRPQRYDRVLWAKNEAVRVEVECVERFGFLNEKGECGSDHYGVCATMVLSRPTASPSNIPTRGKTGDVLFIQDGMDVTSLLEPYLPTKEDRMQRMSAIDVLKETLGAHVILAPLGSYAMDTYFPDSDIDLLVIGAVPPQRFFETAQEQLKTLGGERSSEDGIKGLHFVNSLVPIIEVVVRGIKIDLQYCQAAELVSK
jgi:2'-5' RNA ligase/predicted nucleotidyltransferase